MLSVARSDRFPVARATIFLLFFICKEHRIYMIYIVEIPYIFYIFYMNLMNQTFTILWLYISLYISTVLFIYQNSKYSLRRESNPETPTHQQYLQPLNQNTRVKILPIFITGCEKLYFYYIFTIIVIYLPSRVYICSVTVNCERNNLAIASN